MPGSTAKNSQIGTAGITALTELLCGRFLKDDIARRVGIGRIVRQAVERHDHQRAGASVLECVSDTGRERQTPCLPFWYVVRLDVGPLFDAHPSRSADRGDLSASWVIVIASNLTGMRHDNVDISLLVHQRSIERFEHIATMIARTTQPLDEN
jgi:hypothetical protein